MKKALQYKLLNILCFIAAIYVNYLSVVYKIGGKSIRELSEKYDNLFTPSNRTFAIWSLIYLLVTLFLVVQFFDRYKNEPVTNNFYFSLSCVLNFSWILFWQNEMIVVAMMIMLGLLYTLAKINQQVRDADRPLLKLIFGVYLGWICIATVANVTALLVSLHIDVAVSIQVVATIGILLISALLVMWIMVQLRNPFLAIAVCWAFYGVYSKRMLDHPAIAYTALVMALCVMMSVWVVVRKVRH